MQNNKPIFFWSDLHIGHKNVLELDKRPFKDLDHMHQVLVNNHNSTVPENGVCYFLGDIGLAKAGLVKKIIGQMHGTKVLILGNHDRGPNSMYDSGFDVVLNTATFYIGDSRISMSHCPLPGIIREDVTGMRGALESDNWHGEHKNQRFTSYEVAHYHLHGHIHTIPGGKTPKFTDGQFDVGVAANGYRPVSISQIESWINQQKKSY